MEGFINAAKSAYSEYSDGQKRSSDNQQYESSGQYGQQNVGNNQAVSGLTDWLPVYEVRIVNLTFAMFVMSFEGGDFGVTGGSRFNQP